MRIRDIGNNTIVSVPDDLAGVLLKTSAYEALEVEVPVEGAEEPEPVKKTPRRRSTARKG